MNWTPEALAVVLELDISCPEFIDALCEQAADFDDATEVTTKHVNTVLAWIASTEAKETDQ